MRDMPYAPTVPFTVDPDDNVAAVLEKMQRISFQGRNLGVALDIWRQMLADDCTIWFGLSGAMSAGGMRRLVTFLIQNRYIDVLVSTGANLFHDVYESLGRVHYIGSPHEDDVKLREERMDRVYDTYADEIEFRWLDHWILDWTTKHFDPGDKYTTREYFHELGKHVAGIEHEEGIVTAAYNAGVPIFCPAIADSSYGIALADFMDERKCFTFDVIRDVEETALIFSQSPETGVVYLGGGTPKNFIQQSSVVFDMFERGHKYAIQFTADAPHWGGLSGCTFAEAQSWGKIHPKAHMVSVHVDATIAMPMVATALAQSAADLAAKRRRPNIEQGRVLKVEGKTVTALRKYMEAFTGEQAARRVAEGISKQSK
jgi:deoxyhypusine synthase